MVGKTSLFTILTGVNQSARVGSMETRVGMTKVPDARLDALAKIFDPPKITYATVEYLDFPAISKEALRDPSYLASLRVVDAMAHVLRTFDSDTVPHEKGSVDAVRDFQDVEIELILSDLVVVEKRIERVDKDRKKIKSPDLDKEFALLERIKAELEADSPLRELEFSDEDEKRIRGFQFLSLKPVLCVLNIGEKDAPRLHEVEEEYRNGAIRRTQEHRGHGDLRAGGGRTGRIEARGSERISGELRIEGIGAGANHHGHLFLAGPDELPDRGRDRSSRLDHSHEQHRGESRRRDP